jgi:hypothetical protein
MSCKLAVRRVHVHRKYLKWRSIFQASTVEGREKVLAWLPVLLLYHIVTIEILVMENVGGMV